MKLPRLAACAVAVCLIASADPAFAQRMYEFTKIADSNEFEHLRGGAINGVGTVAFVGSRADGSGGIFTGNGGALTPIVELSATLTSLSTPSLNDGGVVAFIAGFDGNTSGVFTGSGGGLQTIVAAGGAHGPYGEPSINESGVVAYAAAVTGFLNYGVFTSSGGAPTTVATSSGPLRYFSSPRINHAGAVAYFADLHMVNRVGFYYREVGQPQETIYEGRGVFNAGIAPGLNDLGTAALTYLIQPQGYGIFTWNGGSPALTITNTTNAFFQFDSSPDINSAGQIAFWAELDDDRLGIYAGGDPVLDKVIETGDALFGSTISDVYPSPQINDHGDISFTYRLADGRVGIAVARVVPEPAGWAMAIPLVSLSGLVRLGRGRLRSLEAWY